MESPFRLSSSLHSYEDGGGVMRRRPAVTLQPSRGWWGCGVIHTSSLQLSLPSKLKGRGHHSHSSRRDLEAPWGCCSRLLTLSPFAFRRRLLSCRSLCLLPSPPPLHRCWRRCLFKTSPHLLNTTWPSIHATFPTVKSPQEPAGYEV